MDQQQPNNSQESQQQPQQNQLPPEEARRETAQSLRNIVGLIKTGMYLGQNAQYVKEAIDFLEKTAQTIEDNLPKKPELKVVQNTEEAPADVEAKD